MTTLLLSLFLLNYTQRKKEEEGNGSIAAVTFFR